MELPGLFTTSVPFPDPSILDERSTCTLGSGGGRREGEGRGEEGGREGGGREGGRGRREEGEGGGREGNLSRNLAVCLAVRDEL